MIRVIILGILMIAGSGTLSGLLIAHNLSATPMYTPELFGYSLPSVSAVGAFCAGAGLALLFCLGVWMIAAALAERHRGARWTENVDDFLPGQWRAP